jgi:hypothetical protein
MGWWWLCEECVVMVDIMAVFVMEVNFVILVCVVVLVVGIMVILVVTLGSLVVVFGTS